MLTVHPASSWRTWTFATAAPTASARVAATSRAQAGTACQRVTAGAIAATGTSGATEKRSGGAGGVHSPSIRRTPPSAAASAAQAAHVCRCRATAAAWPVSSSS